MPVAPSPRGMSLSTLKTSVSSGGAADAGARDLARDNRIAPILVAKNTAAEVSARSAQSFRVRPIRGLGSTVSSRGPRVAVSQPSCVTYAGSGSWLLVLRSCLRRGDQKVPIQFARLASMPSASRSIPITRSNGFCTRPILTLRMSIA